MLWILGVEAANVVIAIPIVHLNVASNAKKTATASAVMTVTIVTANASVNAPTVKIS